MRCSRCHSKYFPAAFARDNTRTAISFPDQWRTLCWSRWVFLQGTGTCGRAHIVNHVYPERMQPLWSPRWSRSWRNVAHREDPCWSSGKAKRGRSSREELLWTDFSPHCPSGRGYRSWEQGTETEQEKKGSGREVVCYFLALFLTTQIYFKCLEINFPQSKCVLPLIVIGNFSACVYLNPQACSSCFFPLPCLGQVVSEQLGRNLNLIQVNALCYSAVRHIWQLAFLLCGL